MKTASILEAKTHLSKLVRRVERGERITITRGAKAVAVLVTSTRATRPFGIDEGKVHIADDFDAPLPQGIRRTFGVK